MAAGVAVIDDAGDVLTVIKVDPNMTESGPTTPPTNNDEELHPRLRLQDVAHSADPIPPALPDEGARSQNPPSEGDEGGGGAHD